MRHRWPAGIEVGHLLITREGLPDKTIPLYTETAVAKAGFLPRLEVAAWTLVNDLLGPDFSRLAGAEAVE